MTRCSHAVFMLESTSLMTSLQCLLGASDFDMKQQVELLDGQVVKVEYHANAHGSYDIDTVMGQDGSPVQVSEEEMNTIMDELLRHVSFSAAKLKVLAKDYLNPQTGLPDDPEGREQEYRSRRNHALGLESHVDPLAKKLLQSLLSS
jgi:hypothetical protein